MELDYSGMKYNLGLIPEKGTVLETFTELMDYDEFSNEGNDLLIRWTFLVVDDGSPFFKSHRDFTDRSFAVCKYLKMDDDLLLEYIGNRSGLISEKQKKFRVDIDSKIFKFFTLLDKHNYNAWYTVWLNFNETNAFLRIPINPFDHDYEAKFEKKQKISKFLPSIQQDLSNYEKQIFGDTKIKSIVTDNVAKFMNWPEKMAIALADPD